MNKKQVAKLNMGKAVKKLCDENQTIIDTVPAFSDAVSEFSDLLDNFVDNATETKKSIQGVTEEKGFEKAVLAKQTVKIASILFAYAVKNGNRVLKDEVSVSVSGLEKLPDSELPMVSNNISKLAKDNLAAAGTFGLTQAKINVLDGLIKNYTESVPDPRMAISKRKTYNKNVGSTIKLMSKVLSEQMDKLVMNLDEAYPDFVSNYFSDRMVINTAIRHKKKPAEAEEVAKIVDVSEGKKPGDLSIAI